MKVIKKGEKPPKLDPIVRFTCPKCGSLLEERWKALNFVGSEEKRLHWERSYVFKCPVCGAEPTISDNDLIPVRGASEDGISCSDRCENKDAFCHACSRNYEDKYKQKEER